MIIDDTITDLDSPVYFEAKWFDPYLEFYGAFTGAVQVYDVTREEWLELYRDRDHDTCLKILCNHKSRKV